MFFEFVHICRLQKIGTIFFLTRPKNAEVLIFFISRKVFLPQSRRAAKKPYFFFIYPEKFQKKFFFVQMCVLENQLVFTKPRKIKGFSVKNRLILNPTGTLQVPYRFEKSPTGFEKNR